MSNEISTILMYLARLASGGDDESLNQTLGKRMMQNRGCGQFPGGNMNNGKSVRGLGDGGVELINLHGF